MPRNQVSSNSRGTQSMWTPSQENDYSPDELLRHERQRVAYNLGAHNVGTSQDTLPFDMKTDRTFWCQTVNNFLDASPLYDSELGRWRDIPECPSHESELFGPICEIVSDVIDHQPRDGETTPGSREVVVCHNEPMPHATEENSPPTYSAPSLAIRATGPSFQEPRGGAIGYCNVATCIDIRINDSDVDPEQEINTLGVYARQMFNRQPNREFVRCLLVTETHAMLAHFDRAGAQWFPLIDIHGDPFTFARVLFALASFEEFDLGFDTTVLWDHENGRKVGGAVGVNTQADQIKYYPLVTVGPAFLKSDICGSGTRCWRVLDPRTGRELIVKDTWTAFTSSTTLEADILEKARGIRGVVQMVARDKKRVSTSLFRGTPTDLRNAATSKIGTRVVLEAYGKPLYLSNSEEQMIGALRDAIVGHWGLVKAGVLHRDVSRLNVLLGDENAPPGLRGALVDLDLAASVAKLISGETKNLAVGTMPFQSIAVLRSRDSRIARRQIRDYLDDLESFFYVLCDTMFCWEDDECPPCMWTWAGEDDPEAAAWGKLNFFVASREMDLEGCDPHWGSASRGLIKNFFKFIRRIVIQKEKFNRIPSLKESRRARLELLELRDEHYAEVVSFFDRALEQISVGSL